MKPGRKEWIRLVASAQYGDPLFIEDGPQDATAFQRRVWYVRASSVKVYGKTVRVYGAHGRIYAERVALPMEDSNERFGSDAIGFQPPGIRIELVGRGRRH